VAADLMQLSVLLAPTQKIREMRTRDVAAEPSCDGQDLVADEMQANPFGPGPVEEECRRRLKDILAQLLPSITLRAEEFLSAWVERRVLLNAEH
jgi:hypothetical protein